ncbi:MAG: TlpA family protein disulfide reductase [Flavobacterium sp.]
MKKIVFVLFAVIMANTGFAQEMVTLSADIANRNGDAIFIKTPSGKTLKEIKVDEKGIFNSSFSVESGLYLLFDGSEYTIVYLKNGFNLSLKMDAQNFDESIFYTGRGEKENNYLAQKSLINEKYESKMGEVKDKDTFENLITSFKKEFQVKLDAGGFDADFVIEANKLVESESKNMQAQFDVVMKMAKINGSVAPTFNYENFEGDKTKLEDLRGKYVYIDVWATWCGPCRGEIPSLARIEEKYKGKNIAFVSISVDEDKDHDKWKKFVSDKKLGGIQLFADKNWNSEFITAFGINSIPRFILIDPKGIVLNADAPRPSEPILQEKLDSLLK